MSDPISAITLGDMRVEYVRTRMVVDEAEQRADAIASLIEAMIPTEPGSVVVNLVRRFVADTYEIAYGRGYDAAIDDDAPPLVVTPQAGVLLCRHPGCPDNGKPLTIGEGQHDH